MRAFAFFVNIVVLACMVIYITQEKPRDEEWILAAIVFMYPLLNIAALSMGRDDWLRLFFKRKALEEARRIEALKSELTDKQK